MNNKKMMLGKQADEDMNHRVEWLNLIDRPIDPPHIEHLLVVVASVLFLLLPL